MTKLEKRNQLIAYEVGSDIYIGPSMNRITFISKAGGFKWSKNMVTKDLLPVRWQEFINFMRAHGHHENKYGQSIALLRCDSEHVYGTSEMKKILLDAGVKMIMSPTNLKEWNGLAEQGHGQTGRTVTSMLACARHLPERAFWPKAWEYSDVLHNLESCMI
ncbi:MAG: hypothetical protein EB127_18460 [Alphaproteobacteria bacterium]|nr:hypothetical protein [Alphaproteobacteria bacterium]